MFVSTKSWKQKMESFHWFPLLKYHFGYARLQDPGVTAKNICCEVVLMIMNTMDTEDIFDDISFFFILF